jgi:hypothetical protein
MLHGSQFVCRAKVKKSWTAWPCGILVLFTIPTWPCYNLASIGTLSDDGFRLSPDLTTGLHLTNPRWNHPSLRLPRSLPHNLALRGGGEYSDEDEELDKAMKMLEKAEHAYKAAGVGRAKVLLFVLFSFPRRCIM